MYHTCLAITNSILNIGTCIPAYYLEIKGLYICTYVETKRLQKVPCETNLPQSLNVQKTIHVLYLAIYTHNYMDKGLHWYANYIYM